jgi:MGT family glycosyltransferase
MRYLMSTLDAAGNWPPERRLIKALVDRGHEVYVVTDSGHERDIVAAGAEYVPYRCVAGRSLSGPGAAEEPRFEGDSEISELEFVFKTVLLNPDYGDELDGAIDRIVPDVLLVDLMLWSAIAVAERSGLPTAILWHTIYAAWRSMRQLPPFAIELLNTQRQGLGLDAVTDFVVQVERAAAITAFTLAEFDAPSAKPPGTLHYVGPLGCLPERLPKYQLPWPADDDRPLVLVSYSTSFMDQAALLQRVADALADLPVRGLLTLGSAVPADQIAVRDNVVAETFVPHASVLPETALVVTHAGHGTTMAAVTAGVPLVCTPMGRDQHEVSECVERNGLGIVVSQDANVDELRETIDRALADTAMRDRCRTFADAIDLDAGLSTAIDVLEGMRHAPQ